MEHDSIASAMHLGMHFGSDSEQQGDESDSECLLHLQRQIVSDIDERRKGYRARYADMVPAGHIDVGLVDGDMHIASWNGHVEVVKHLIENGSDVNQCKDRCGDVMTSPLHLACRHGHMAVARELIEASADVNAVDGSASGYGASALHEASQNGHLDIVIVLLAYGTRPKRTKFDGDAEGYDAMQLALEEGHDEIVEFLGLSSEWTELCYAHDIERLLGEASAAAWVQALLRGGKPLALASQIAAEKPCATTEFILSAARPWCPATHHLFPSATRQYVVALFQLLNPLCKSRSVPVSSVYAVLAFVVQRSE